MMSFSDTGTPDVLVKRIIGRTPDEIIELPSKCSKRTATDVDIHQMTVVQLRHELQKFPSAHTNGNKAQLIRRIEKWCRRIDADPRLELTTFLDNKICNEIHGTGAALHLPQIELYKDTYPFVDRMDAMFGYLQIPFVHHDLETEFWFWLVKLFIVMCYSGFIETHSQQKIRTTNQIICAPFSALHFGHHLNTSKHIQ